MIGDKELRADLAVNELFQVRKQLRTDQALVSQEPASERGTSEFLRFVGVAERWERAVDHPLFRLSGKRMKVVFGLLVLALVLAMSRDRILLAIGDFLVA